MKIKGYFFTLLLIICSVAKASQRPLYPVLTDVNNKASLQRGAKFYINYCAGCHSLRYVRYQQLAMDLNIVDEKGKVLETIVKENLIFNDAKLSHIIKVAMPAESAKKWFGVTPPDLSLVAKAKGADWIYTYLRSFYKDPTRRWGTNNLLVPGVAMPNVLIHLQGIQIPVYKRLNGSAQLTIDHLVLIEKGQYTPRQLNDELTDLVNFLVYISEPTVKVRKQLGWWVLTYLAIMLGLVFYLRRASKS